MKDIEDISYISEMDSYVIYETGDRLYKLDLQKNEKLPIVTAEGRQIPGWIVRDRQGKIISLGGSMFALAGENLYCIDAERGTGRQIYSGGKWEEVMLLYRDTYMVLYDHAIYFTFDNETLWRYRDGEEQAECVISKDVFSEALEEMGLKKGKQFAKYDITELLLYGERIYFAIKETEVRGEKENFCMLSASLTEPIKLQKESAVTEYWQTWDKVAGSADAVSDAIRGQILCAYKPGEIAGIVDGKVILSGMRLMPVGSSLVLAVYCAAYDPEKKQVWERPDIRKVIP